LTRCKVCSKCCSLQQQLRSRQSPLPAASDKSAAPTQWLACLAPTRDKVTNDPHAASLSQSTRVTEPVLTSAMFVQIDVLLRTLGIPWKTSSSRCPPTSHHVLSEFTPGSGWSTLHRR
jgi:hypothetical protein